MIHHKRELFANLQWYCDSHFSYEFYNTEHFKSQIYCLFIIIARSYIHQWIGMMGMRRVCTACLMRVELIFGKPVKKWNRWDKMGGNSTRYNE